MSVKENHRERQVLRNLYIEVKLFKHNVFLHLKLALLVWPSLIHNLKEVANRYENLSVRNLSTRKTSVRVCVYV